MTDKETEAGHELDVAVAKAMGWVFDDDPRSMPGWGARYPGASLEPVSDYSANNDDGVWEMLQWLMENTDGGMTITMRNEYCSAAIPRYSVFASGDTLPHALALLVVRIAEQETARSRAASPAVVAREEVAAPTPIILPPTRAARRFVEAARDLATELETSVAQGEIRLRDLSAHQRQRKRARSAVGQIQGLFQIQAAAPAGAAPEPGAAEAAVDAVETMETMEIVGPRWSRQWAACRTPEEYAQYLCPAGNPVENIRDE